MYRCFKSNLDKLTLPRCYQLLVFFDEPTNVSSILQANC